MRSAKASSSGAIVSFSWPHPKTLSLCSVIPFLQRVRARLRVAVRRRRCARHPRRKTVQRRQGSWQNGVAAATLTGAGPSWANPLPFTWDPSQAGLTGSAFTADTIIQEEFLRGVGQPDGSFVASRILVITGFSLNGNPVTPAGFGSSYGLYFDIVDTGVDHLPVSITFASSDFILKADPATRMAQHRPPPPVSGSPTGAYRNSR